MKNIRNGNGKYPRLKRKVSVCKTEQSFPRKNGKVLATLVPVHFSFFEGNSEYSASSKNKKTILNRIT